MIATALLAERVTLRTAVAGLSTTTWTDRLTAQPCRLVPARRSVRDDQGSDHVTTMRATFRPDVDVRIGDQLINGTDTYTVVAVRTAVELGRPWALLADLEGPR